MHFSVALIQNLKNMIDKYIFTNSPPLSILIKLIAWQSKSKLDNFSTNDNEYYITELNEDSSVLLQRPPA